MRRPIRPAAGRGGFTLVELLVAAALALVVMTILAFAFQTGLGTLSQLRSVVGLADQLRSAEEVMKRDLGDSVLAPDIRHLEDDNGDRLRLSALKWNAFPANGYFRVAQYTRPVQSYNTGDPPNPFNFPPTSPRWGIDYDSAAPPKGPSGYPYWFEGNDDNLAALSSFRATDHVLQFTVKLPGGKASEVFTAQLPQFLQNSNWPLVPAQPSDPPNPVLKASLPGFDPSGTKFVSQWAEVSYHLEPNGQATVDASDPNDPTAPPAGQLQVYALVRRQRLLAPPGSGATNVGPQLPNPVPSGSFKSAGKTITLADLLEAPDLAITVDNPGANPAPYRLNSPGPLTKYVGTSPVYAAFAADPNIGNQVNWRAQHRLGGIQDPLGAGAVPFNSPKLDRPYRIPLASSEYGSDVLLNNVVSMQVRLIYTASPYPDQYADPPLSALSTNPAPPSPALTPAVASKPDGSSRPDSTTRQNEQAGLVPPRQTGNPPQPIIQGGAFDTAVVREIQYPDPSSGTTQYATYGVKAIQIKLRVYDAKNKVTRQMTIAQDL